MSMSKGRMARCHSTCLFQSIWSSNMCSYTKFFAFSQWANTAMYFPKSGKFSPVQLLEFEWSAFSVFTTNPAKLMICLQVCEFFNSSPATLAGIHPCSFLLDQLCFEFVEFWHVVSEEQVITWLVPHIVIVAHYPEITGYTTQSVTCSLWSTCSNPTRNGTSTEIHWTATFTEALSGSSDRCVTWRFRFKFLKRFFVKVRLLEYFINKTVKIIFFFKCFCWSERKYAHTIMTLTWILRTDVPQV